MPSPSNLARIDLQFLLSFKEDLKDSPTVRGGANGIETAIRALVQNLGFGEAGAVAVETYAFSVTLEAMFGPRIQELRARSRELAALLALPDPSDVSWRRDLAETCHTLSALAALVDEGKAS